MMAKSAKRYPVFEVEEDVASRGRALERIIPEIAPGYFLANPRFKGLGQLSSPRLIDWLGIYEEGDYWTLAIVAVNIGGAFQHLFIPFAEAIPPDNRIPGLGNPAFGLEITSSFYGKRQWEVFDAFADPTFQRKIFNLFLPYTDIPETHMNAYVQLQESGVGSFEFHSKHNSPEPLYPNGRCELEYLGNDIRLSLLDHYLELHQVLPIIVNRDELEKSPQVVGWIEYSGIGGVRLEIGVLYHRRKFHLNHLSGE